MAVQVKGRQTPRKNHTLEVLMGIGGMLLSGEAFRCYVVLFAGFAGGVLAYLGIANTIGLVDVAYAAQITPALTVVFTFGAMAIAWLLTQPSKPKSRVMSADERARRRREVQRGFR
jgi:hypothetical protein